MTVEEQSAADVPLDTVPLKPEEDFVRIRFAGDSGDGMQLTGTRFAAASADFGNDFSTFPDFPAEIRAPVGTTYGVSAYSINIGRTEIQTFGDQPDVLVALNPAALKTNVGDLRDGGLIILDEGTFNPRNLAKAGYDGDPREDGSFGGARILAVDISALTLKAVEHLKLGQKNALRSKNMWTLGLVLWMFGRSRRTVINWLNKKFSAQPDIAEANVTALNAGYAYGETMELSADIPHYDIEPAHIAPGTYRAITGSEAVAVGLRAATKLAGLDMVFASYPITPASPLLHALAGSGDPNVSIFQAEDEIAAICAAIGASFAGKLGVTSSSGPGIALKTEAMGLAISAELPLVVVNVQRGGPSTGLPTKTEQSDLFQAVFGRNGDAPVPVIAASRPSDCFDCAIEAARMALRIMSPVILLSDGYIANMTEPWHLPDLSDARYGPIPTNKAVNGAGPFDRDPQSLGRRWIVPGTPDGAHRIGGLEKDFQTGNVSYDPANHQTMTDMRVDKVQRLRAIIPDQTVDQGTTGGKLAIVSWGSTYGSVRIATMRARVRGLDVSHIHLRHMWPLPPNLEELLDSFDRILVPELNSGQLATLLRSQFDRHINQINKVTGQPFKVTEINNAIAEFLEQVS